MKSLLLAALAALLVTTGCKSGTPNTRLVAQTSTYVATTILMSERPDTRPWLLTATPVICAAAAGTNAVPTVLVADLEALPNSNPYGAMFLNTTLSLFFAYYDANDPDAQAALRGICDGLNMGLASGRKTKPFPHLRMK